MASNAEVLYTKPEKIRTLIGVFLGYLFDGYDLQLLSYLIPSISISFAVQPFVIASSITITLIGSVIGGLLFGWIADILGRRRTLLLTIFVFGLFTLLTGFADNIFQFFLLRFFSGLGIGGEWGIGFSLLNEAWSERTRGAWGGVLQSMFQYGILGAATTAGFFIAGYGTALGWRYSFIFAGLVSLLLLSVRFIIPESKVWLMYAEKRRAGELPAGYDVRAPIIQIFSRKNIRWTLLTSFYSAFALFGGYSMIVFMPTYLGGPPSCQSCLHIPIATYTFMIILAVIAGTPGYWLDGFLADKFGRKRVAQLFIAGLLVTLVAFFYQAVSITSAEVSHMSIQSIPTFPIFYILIAFNFFNGYFAHMGVWYGELFPTKIRATSTNFAYIVAGRGLGAGLAPILIPILSGIAGYGWAMAVGAISASAVALIISTAIKETKGTVITPL
ncbi:MAG: MFS transporter [Conexivisphaerales archaeon]